MEAYYSFVSCFDESTKHILLKLAFLSTLKKIYSNKFAHFMVKFCQKEAQVLNLKNNDLFCHFSIELSGGFILEFPYPPPSTPALAYSESAFARAELSPNSTHLTELAACFWMRSSLMEGSKASMEVQGTPFSYSTPGQPDAFTLSNYNG